MASPIHPILQFLAHLEKWQLLRCNLDLLAGFGVSPGISIVFFHRDELQARTLVFLTNNFLLPADTIAALYKARWEIELFFKWIKQNLKVKSFFGTSANAVKIQIWITMIVYLILAIIRERYRLESSLSQLLHFLEVNLFEQKSLVSIFSMNSRRMPTRSLGNDNQLKLFDY